MKFADDSKIFQTSYELSQGFVRRWWMSKLNFHPFKFDVCCVVTNFLFIETINYCGVIHASNWFEEMEADTTST